MCEGVLVMRRKDGDGEEGGGVSCATASLLEDAHRRHSQQLGEWGRVPCICSESFLSRAHFHPKWSSHFSFSPVSL